MTRRTRRNLPIAVAMALLLALSLFCVGCERPEGRKNAPDAAPVPGVRVLVLEPRRWSWSLTTCGVVEPAVEIEIRAESGGTVRSVHFLEGRFVRKSQLLLAFDDRMRQLRLSQAAASVEDAAARLEKARRVLGRRKALWARKVVSREEYETALADFRRAAAAHSEALSARGQARRELLETRLMSPIDGRVAKRMVDPGEAVMPGRLLAVIQGVGSLRVRTFVSEKDIHCLRVGDAAVVTSPGAPRRRYAACVESLAAEADPETGNFEILLRIRDPDDRLRPGMTARVSMECSAHEDVLLMPEKAVVDRDRGRVAYKLVKGRAVKVAPWLGPARGGWVPILGGLEPGDAVVVEGLESLVDGSFVNVLGEWKQ